MKFNVRTGVRQSSLGFLTDEDILLDYSVGVYVKVNITASGCGLNVLIARVFRDVISDFKDI